MEKLFGILRKIMLAILLALIALALTLTLIRGFEYHSYLVTLAAGLLWGGALVFILRRFDMDRLSPIPACAALTGLCVLVNLAWVLIIRIEPFSDYETYWAAASALALHGEFTNPWYLAMYPHILGYSSFLAVFIRLFGTHVMTAALLNVFLSALSGILIFAIALRLRSLRCACAAEFIWALYPTRTMLNSLVLSEPLYTCLILLFVYLLICFDEDSKVSPLRFALFGLGLGLLLCWINTVRPIAAILIIAMLIWLLFLGGLEIKNRRRCAAWLLLTLTMLVSYRVCAQAWDRHVESLLSLEPASVPIYNIYVGFNEETQGQWSAEDMDLLFSYLQQPGTSASQAQSMMLPHLRERIASGIDFGRLFMSKLFVFLGNDELGGYTYRFTRPELFVKLCMVIDNAAYYGVLFAALGGIVYLMKERERSVFGLMPLYIIGLTLAHMLVEVSSRYHYSIVPMIIILAALGFDRAAEGRS